MQSLQRKRRRRVCLHKFHLIHPTYHHFPIVQENTEKLKFKREQADFRQFLAKQIAEKNQLRRLEQEKNNAFIKQVLDRDSKEQKEEKGQFNIMLERFYVLI